MTLDEYLQDKVLPPFSYKVTDDELVLSFDTISLGEEVSAIHIRNEIDYKVFHRLLAGRTINITGNALYGTYILFHIDNWNIYSPIPIINWI